MKRKVLSVVLCVCMMMTMAPFAFAEEGDSETPEAVVAKIDEQGYTTLQAAIDAATTGQTVTLVTDTSGAGLFLKNNGDASKNITIDFANHTYTVNQLVGSTGSKNQAAHFEENNSVTLKNGTLTVDSSVAQQAKILVQNYCNLTAENMTFDGSNLLLSSQQPFTLSNNDGVVNFTNCLVTTPKDSARNPVAVDAALWGSYNGADVTMTDCTVDGKLDVAKYEYDQSKRAWVKTADLATKTDGTPLLKINGGAFTDLKGALLAATNGSTIKLLADTTVSSPIAIQKNISLDLNGKTITTTCSQVFQIVAQNNFAGGSLKVTGEGTINANSKNGTFYLIGTEQSDSNKASKLVIDKDVKIINGAYSVWVQNTASEYASYNVTADIYGSITAIEPIYVSGNIHGTTGNVPVIHLYDSSKIDVTRYDREVYIGGYAKMIIDDGATIINTANDGNAIAIAAGELIVNGGTIIGGNTIKDVEGSGGAISVTTSSAIFVKQHSTNLPVKVEIKGGIFKGAVPFHQATGENGNSAKPEDVNLLISGGYFASTLSTADGGVAVKSDDKTATTNSGFITGGYFNTDPSKYCGTKDGKQLTGVTSDNADYPYTVGEKGATAAPVTSTSLPASVPADASDELKEAAKNIDGASMASDTIEAAVKTTANDNKLTTDSKVANSNQTVLEAVKEIADNPNSVSANDVKIVYQTYVDVELTDVTTGTTTGEGSATPPITELTVNLTPKYRVIATTANVESNDLYVAGDWDGNSNGVNAVLVQEAQTLTLPEAEYEVTITLPSSFFATASAQVSIKHEKKPGVFEYYTGTVSCGEHSEKYVTFTTNGFSPFTISAAAAKIGETVYPSLEEAVNAVKDNETITLMQDVPSDTKITVAKTVSFTVNKDSHTFDKDQIVAGANTTVETVIGDHTVGYTFTYTRPSHSSSGSTTTSYNVNVNAATNGTVAADKKTAAKGATVTVTATPSAGYVVDAVKVVDKDGKDVAVTAKDGKYVFTMPGSAVTVSAAFKAETPAPSGLPFTDVKSGDWFYEAVKYAYENGLMTGTSATTFAPNGTMNRAMIVTVLYRLEKSPAVTAAAKFTDVPAGQWYSDAVAWAAANNIVNGYSETSFGPLNAVTREQMAAILFRYEQYKGLENVTLEENLNRFPDQDKISSYAVPAMQWAVGQKIINGNADGTLDPTGTATRAQVAQIFMNLLK